MNPANRKNNILVYCGRFQPFHNGHLEVVRKAAEYADHIVILVGSANKTPNEDNPFTSDERCSMISESVVCENIGCTISIKSLNDHDTAEDWVKEVKEKAVPRGQHHRKDFYTYGIIGHHKDSSSWYLDLFPDWKKVEAPNYSGINAKDIRKVIYEDMPIEFIKGVVPKNIYNDLVYYKETGRLDWAKGEYQFHKNYNLKNWDVCAITADCVVTMGPFVLLIERKDHPGKGLLALPGGFVGKDEDILDAALRELEEETGLINVKQYVKKARWFHSPKRSKRGRIITRAHLIQIPFDDKVDLKSGDDASKAKWVSCFQIKENKMFEDHYKILESFGFFEMKLN